MELSENQAEIEAMGVRVLGLTYDSSKDNLKFSTKHSIGFPILSDEGSAVIKTMNLLNESLKGRGKYYGVAHPGIFILDGEGRITAKLAEDDYRKRPAMSLVLETLKGSE